MPRKNLICERFQWKGRDAFRLANERLELCALVEGGAIASLRLRDGVLPRVNTLWEAPWNTLEPSRFKKKVHEKSLGAEPVGRFLAGFTGHTLCLDYFGAPSEEEIKQGFCLHGEASVLKWRTKQHSASQAQSCLTQEVRLPHAGLHFRRELCLRSGELVVLFSESVRNLRHVDHFFHWVQHVTFGLPFLSPSESSVYISGTRAITWPNGYEGKSLLADSQEFTWPNAPAKDGSVTDISQPFSQTATGFVASVLLDQANPVGCFAILNCELGLVQGYLFSRELFPWIAVWEENLARNGAPWNGRTRARGMEFGTTPMPVGKLKSFLTGSLFGVPTFCRVPALSELHTTYASFLSPVGTSWNGIRNIRLDEDAIVVESTSGESVAIAAKGLKAKIAA